MISFNLSREMEILQREMNAIFGDAVHGQAASRSFLAGNGPRQSPRINLSEDADNFYLAALLPGIEGESLDISLVGNSLTLSGDRHDKELKDARWQRRERGQGKFMRTIELPLEVEADKIKAEYLNGMLQVLLPKSETAKPRRISINPAN